MICSFAITTVFPDLIALDLERLKEIASDDDAGANVFLHREVRPLNPEIVSDVIRMIIFGLLLYWHLLGLLQNEKDF
ncbi:MAG: hypothetical protein VX167_03745 [Pseudomonadota bacterium]|nr:hypothetical protein [Pseudomonadota bacterium]